MDVAYIVDQPTRELRLSVRSLAAYVPHKRLFVVGSDPGWLSDAAIFVENNHPKKKDDAAWAIKEQLLKVCETDISDDFILMNDDLFILAETCEFPYYHKGTIPESLERIKSGPYYGHLLATNAALKRRGLPVLHFDGHWPIVYNKHKLKKIIEEQDWRVALGPTMRSLYCNTLGIAGEKAEDIKANRSQKWEEWTKGMSAFSTGDESFDGRCERFLLNLFPEKCRYEK